jgi:arabinan endo-1,5-alpha-L-arabinosidase
MKGINLLKERRPGTVRLPTDMRLFSFLFAISLAVLTQAQVGPGVVTGNTAVHDPTMCKDASGRYFVFCEFMRGMLYLVVLIAIIRVATAPGIEIRTSTDRTAWTLVGKVWPNGAPWTDQYTGTSNG